jgi:hypothetical protein
MDATLLFGVLFGAGKFEDTFGDIEELIDPQMFSEQPMDPEAHNCSHLASHRVGLFCTRLTPTPAGKGEIRKEIARNSGPTGGAAQG